MTSKPRLDKFIVTGISKKHDVILFLMEINPVEQWDYRKTLALKFKSELDAKIALESSGVNLKSNSLVRDIEIVLYKSVTSSRGVA